MKFAFWRSEADIEGAKRRLRASCDDVERAHTLAAEGSALATRIRVLHDSNGFAEAIARFYRSRAN